MRKQGNCDPKDLSTRGASVVLAANPGPVVDPSTPARSYEAILATEAEEAASRLLTVGVDHDVNLRVQWSSGQGQHQALVSCAAGVRICFWARSVTVEVQAKHPTAETRVNVSVADGWEATRNEYIVDLDAAVGAQSVRPPAFSQRVRLHLSDPAVLATGYVDLVDFYGDLRSRHMGNAQPPEGIPLAGTETISVLATVAGRLVFHLCL